MKRVLLTTITENDQCSSSFVSSLVQSVRVGLSNNTEILPVFFPSLGNWAMAANRAITIAHQNKLNGLVFVNPNVGWNPENLMDLCETEKDAAAIPVATRGGFDISLGEIARLQEDEKTGEIKVLGVSLDFFYLSAYAIEKLCETHPTVTYLGEDCKLILQSGDIYSSYHTHAEVFAYRLGELGIEIWVNPLHTAYRQDTVEYPADFAAILKDIKDGQ